MPKDHEKQRMISRRAVLFGGAQVAAFSLLASRLAYLQFIRSEEYASLSENNHIKLQPLAADRGLLLDRFGLIIADNSKAFRLYVDPSGITRDAYRTTLEQLQGLLDVPATVWEQLQKIKPNATTPPQLVKDQLSWEEVSRIELHALSLPGAYIEAGQLRNYPAGQEVAHLTGYMGAATDDEMAKDAEQALLRLPDFKIGKNGVEKMLEKRLRGVAGIRKLEVNVHGVVVREVGRTESISGENVVLTIDSRAQHRAAESIKDESASVVAIEVETGNVLALVSLPAYDPNVFSRGITYKEWNRLSADKKVPLLNKTIAGMYPPGSTFKMMVGMAGLEAGLITPSFRVHCPGYYMLGDHRFGCWKAGGHGTVNYHEAIAQSCDTFFYTVAGRIGPEPYADVARRCGLGQVHHLGIIGEKRAAIPDPDWKMQTYQQRWTAGDTINCSIGQGYVLATPLQLAVMASRIASGRVVKPRLVVPPGEERPTFDALDIDPDILERTREAMIAVVNGPTGTARGSRIQDPRYSFAGKTGTSQVRKLIRLGMNQSLLPWEARHHALFVGFAPVEQPKYAVAVVVEHGGGGAAAAAPIARDVLLMLQQIEAEKKDAAV